MTNFGNVETQNIEVKPKPEGFYACQVFQKTMLFFLMPCKSHSYKMLKKQSEPTSSHLAIAVYKEIGCPPFLSPY